MTVRPGFFIALYVTLFVALWAQIPQAYESAKENRQAIAAPPDSIIREEGSDFVKRPSASFFQELLLLIEDNAVKLEEIRYDEANQNYLLSFRGSESNILDFYQAFEKQPKIEILEAIWSQVSEEGISQMWIRVSLK